MDKKAGQVDKSPKTMINLKVVLVTSLLIAFAFGACDEGNNSCDHTWIDGEIITVATCEVAGLQKLICSDCGEEGEPKTINMLGHDWDNEDGILTNATCTEDGGMKRTCEREDCTKYEIIGEVESALGHLGLIAPFEETCTEAGNSEYSGICTRDGCAQPEVIGTVTIALGHLGLTAPFEATCTEAGNSEEHGTCTRNGCAQPEVIGTVISALGHLGLTAPFEATCTVPGNSEYSGTCTRNGCAQPEVLGTVTLAGHGTWNWATYNSSTGGKVYCVNTDCPGGFAEIGDTGPAGGIIFFVAEAGFDFFTGTTADDNTTVKLFYLEASTVNLTGGTGSQTLMRWSTTDWLYNEPEVDSAAKVQTIGAGRRNTALIIAAETAMFPTCTYIYAALACDKYGEGTVFNDWFLPSADELNAMYIAGAAPNNVAGLPTTGFFWSSSLNFFGSHVWTQNFFRGFGSGSRNTSNKNNTHAVRAVRAF
jgi:hypothetical protein